MFILFLSSLNYVSAENVTEINYLSDFDIIAGTLVDGNIDYLKLMDGDFINIQESNTTDAILINLSFDVSGHPKDLFINAYYDGGASHSIDLQVLNNSDWVSIRTYNNQNNFEYDTIDISNYDFDCEESCFRIVHNDSGIDTHNFYIDYLVLSSEVEEDIDFNLFDFELDNTSHIIFLIVFIIIMGFFAIYGNYPMSDLGSFGLLLSGFILLFNNFNIILSLVVAFIGLIFIFRE